MRRLAFVLLASLIVGLASAAPARAYFPFFHHHPHHFHQPHHPHHGALVPAGPVQPITPGQVIGAIHIGQQLAHLFLPGLGQQPNNNQPQPAAPPRVVGADVTKKLTENATRLNGITSKTNDLLEKVRVNDPRYNKTNLPDLAAAPKAGAGPAPADGVNVPAGGDGAPKADD